MLSARRRALALASFLAGLIALGGCSAAYVARSPGDVEDYPRNFGVVENGMLYRSGVPDEEDMRVLKEELGLKAIVSLVKADSSKTLGYWRREKDFADKNDVHFFYIPISNGEVPTPEQVSRFFDIVSDTDNRPLLVHCKEGRDRAGVMVAAYRIAHDGWSAEQALAEMETYGFVPAEDAVRVQFVETYAKAHLGGAREQSSDHPATRRSSDG